MSPSSSADSTRERILAAAKAEFSRHGIAGARVDRIAAAAKTSKERVYAYFRGKEALYRHVAGEELAAIAEATRMDPTDLPGYAGRIHDYFAEHPDKHRLMRWGQLEFAGSADAGVTAETMRRKTEQIRRAQHDGHLDPDWDPLDILVFVNQLATSWADQPEAGEREARRAAIVTAVQRLFPARIEHGEKDSRASVG